ncbi:MAG: TadG family pilus assembly protein, partial [Proteobacteria bacterium]|nr:TadG family pilus assembly protein [Pseudomonadota bacterium]
MIAAGFAAIAGLATITIDVGQLYYLKAQLQATADSAVLAAAQELPSQANASTAAVTMATNNMPVAEHGNVLINGDIVFGNWNNATRTFTPGGAPTNAVRATTKRAQSNGNPAQLFFAQVLGFSQADIVGQAIASNEASGSFCILSTDPSNPSAVKLNGTVNLNLGACGIAVTSTHASKAFDASGTVTVNASSICVAGGASQSGNGSINPTPEEGCTPPPDPLADLPPPNFANSCDELDFSVSGNGATITLDPGVYCNGIDISGNSNIINFNPGVYVFAEGGLSVAGGGNVLTSLTGAGIGGTVFYNTGAAGGGGTSGDIDFSGNSTINLSAPSSGTYSGVLFFQDPTTANAGIKFKVAGTVDTTFDGVAYFPDHEVEFSGTTSQSLRCFKIIGKTVTFNGTTGTTIPPSCVSDAVS